MVDFCPTCEENGAICDFCHHYNFNGNKEGAYTGNGKCEHPKHPKPMEPYYGCDDFSCWELYAKSLKVGFNNE